MVERYSEWMSAARENFNNLRRFKREMDFLISRIHAFLNMNVARARTDLETEYRNLQIHKTGCDQLLSEMGRLGDAMKHYSNKNKAIMNKDFKKAQAKYKDLRNRLEHLKQEEKSQ